MQFEVKNGVLYGVGLVKSASILIKQNGSSGQTEFDTLSSNLHMSGRQFQFKQLYMRSGSPVASVDVTISPSKSLNVTMTVSLKHGVDLTKMPMNVSGTLSNPSVFPTKAALACPAVGKTLLPSVGTGMGIKSGNALSKFKGMFGK